MAIRGFVMPRLAYFLRTRELRKENWNTETGPGAWSMPKVITVLFSILWAH
jgi:hypothetical protein